MSNLTNNPVQKPSKSQTQSGKASNLLFPYSVRVSDSGQLYVTDTYNHRIRRAEKGTLAFFAGGTDGLSLRSPTDTALAPNGDMFMTSPDHNRIMVQSKKSGLSKEFKLSRLDDSSDSRILSPTQLDIFENHLYISDTLQDKIIVVDLDTKKGCSFSVPRPLGIAVNRVTREITFTMRGSNAISVWRNGQVTTLAGSALSGLIDGTTTATFFEPYGLSAGADGSIYVADAGNHAVRVIDPDLRVVTLAGDGSKGQDDGPNGTFNYPMGVSSAPDGCLYVADTYNHSIRKVLPNLEVETVF